MEVEIKLAASGAIEMGKAPKDTLTEVAKLLNNNPKEVFIEIETKRGPILINKSNILTIKKRQ